MKRRTFDLLVSGGAMLLAALLVVIGLVLAGNANFARTYVGDQLRQQKITFKTSSELSAEERQAGCLRSYAGQALTTGKQAECYANEFIALHMRTNAQAKGMTYAELGTAQAELRAKIAATSKTDPNLAEYQRSLADLTTARETMFKGETLRGLLLTSYGFSIFGEKAHQAAIVVYVLAFLLAVLSILGFIHALVTPRSRPLDHLAVQPEPAPHEGVPVIAGRAKNA